MSSADEVSEAIVIWSGFGEEVYPRRDERRVVTRLGEDRAVDLLPQVKRLADEFYESDAYATEPDLAAVGRKAAATFRDRHPELSDAAVEALTWCYTWDWK